jgi:hypothetical protein
MGVRMTVKYNTAPKGTSDEHYTPKEIFEALKIVFDVDVAAPVGGSSWVPAKSFLDKEIDGLKVNWVGNVWMNPPYSNPSPWVAKFLNHKQGIALLPITRGKWWDSMWNECEAILPTKYNLSFIRPDGMKAKPIVFRTALYAIGETNITALKASGLGKLR